MKLSRNLNRNELKRIAELCSYLEGNGDEPICRWFNKSAQYFGRVESSSEDWVMLLHTVINKMTSDTHISSMTLLIPEYWDSVKGEIIIQQSRCKAIDNGLVLGLLHPLSKLKTLTNSRFEFPFKTDLIWLNIRKAVKQDLIFFEPETELWNKFLKAESNSKINRD